MKKIKNSTKIWPSCKNMTVDDNRVGGGQTTVQHVNIWMIPI